MAQDLVASVEKIEGEFFSGRDEVLVRLKNGRIIHISPEFNSINVWDNEKALQDFNLNHCVTMETDMGGDAAGFWNHEDPKAKLRLR